MKPESSLIFLYVILIFLGFGLLVFMHEKTHQEIYRHYDIDSRVEYFSHFPDVVTISEDECPNEYCILANNITDNIGYHLYPIYFIVSFGFLLIAVFLNWIIIDLKYYLDKQKIYNL